MSVTIEYLLTLNLPKADASMILPQPYTIAQIYKTLSIEKLYELLYIQYFRDIISDHTTVQAVLCFNPRQRFRIISITNKVENLRYFATGLRNRCKYFIRFFALLMSTYELLFY
jgi:hypothetical protein